MENEEWKELSTIGQVAEAVAAGMEIECHNYNAWVKWKGLNWHSELKYRARPKQPKTMKVKSLCWRQKDTGELMWCQEGNAPICYPVASLYARFPAGDLAGEVEA